MLHPWLTPLVLALPVLPWWGAQDPAPERAPAEAAPQEPAPDEDPWRALLERDGEVGFAPITLRMALDDLEGGELSPAGRAGALMALGSSGGPSERSRLETRAREGTQLERQAAILALGELSGTTSSELRAFLDDPDEVLFACAALALLRRPDVEAGARVREIAASADDSRAGAALALVTFRDDPAASRESPAARLLLDLRYQAARRYGLIGGKTYKVALIDQLGQDDAFLDRFIYRAATRVKRPGVRDHFLGVVLEERSEPGLTAAMNVLPTEIAQMVAEGVWTPDDHEWAILLTVIEERGIEALAEPLLAHALTYEGLSDWAALLLLRGGNLRGRAVLEQALAESDVAQTRRAVDGLGASGNQGFIGWLSSFAEDTNPEIRGAALVAQARLGHRGAETTIDILLASPDLAAKQVPIETLVEALARAGSDPVTLALLSHALPNLEGRPRMLAATTLAAAKRIEGTEIVRAALRAVPPAGAPGARHLAALLSLPTQESLKLVRELFPRGNDLEVDVELALALLDARDPSIRSILRAAMWRGPFHRSVLAAALFVDAVGIDMLRVEVEGPPRSARPADVRRVGFALGEWGGLQQVESLASRAGAGDAGLQGALLGALSARTQ